MTTFTLIPLYTPSHSSMLADTPWDIPESRKCHPRLGKQSMSRPGLCGPSFEAARWDFKPAISAK